MTSIVDAPEYLFTSESVTEGHPDKMCDQISDAILDAIIAEDPVARVACETATTTGLVVVLGEISTTTYIDFQQVVRATVRDIGYTRSEYGFDYETCGTLVSIKEQSPDIAQGVNDALAPLICRRVIWRLKGLAVFLDGVDGRENFVARSEKLREESRLICTRQKGLMVQTSLNTHAFPKKDDS